MKTRVTVMVMIIRIIGVVGVRAIMVRAEKYLLMS